MFSTIPVAMTLCLLHCCGVAQTISTMPGWTSIKKELPAVAAVQSVVTGENTALYQVGKQQTQEGAVKEWFNRSIQIDLEKERWKEPARGTFNETTGVLIYLTEVKDSSDKKHYLLYMGYGFGKQQVRMARLYSTHDNNFFQLTGMQASKHFGQLAQQDMKSNTTVAEKNNNIPKTVVQNKTDAMISKGKGIKSAEIHSVIMHLEYESGIGGGIYPVYNAYILLKNGSIYKYPEVSPADLLVTESQKTEPLKWGTWKMNGGTLTTYWAAEKPRNQNESWEKSTYYIVPGAKKGERLEGIFKTLSGGGNTALGGEVMVVAAANITFATDGKFTLASVAGVSSGRDIWENTNSSSNAEGVYYLDEYTIELKYNNGKTERRFFFFYPDSKKHFGIGQSIYMPKKN